VHAIRVPDTMSYLRLSRMSTVEGALTHYRTYGYPLLIKIFGWRELPGRELWIFFVAVLAFYGGVAAYARSQWLALAAASPLLYGQALGMLGRLQPDFVAGSWVLFAVASLLGLVARPRNVLLWCGLAASVFAAYQFRPATLILVAWLPVIGFAVRAWRERRLDRRLLAWAVGLALATVLPYLAFCSWRYARVGDFGLVSFGGYNMCGMAATLLEPSLIRELEGEERLMGNIMYKMRQKRDWQPYRSGEGSEQWFAQYSDNIWRICAAVAKRQVQEAWAHAPDEPDRRYLRLEINDKLSAFSKSVIRLRVGHYLSWVRDANLYGWRQLRGSPWVVWPALLLAIFGLVLAGGRRFGLLARGGRGDALRLVSALGVLGLSFFLAYVALISLLSFPFSRYYYGTVLLLPSALCFSLAVIWQEIGRSLPGVAKLQSPLMSGGVGGAGSSS